MHVDAVFSGVTSSYVQHLELVRAGIQSVLFYLLDPGTNSLYALRVTVCNAREDS